MEKWLSTTETCERLGVTSRTLYRLIDEGKIPAFKMGRVIRLKEPDVISFVRREDGEGEDGSGTAVSDWPKPNGDAPNGTAMLDPGVRVQRQAPQGGSRLAATMKARNSWDADYLPG
jgi:excisionase family DNA binding protein